MNPVEKRLPKPVRDNMRTLIAAGLGLFLGLQYNDYIQAVLDKFLPASDSLIMRGLILLVVTVLIVYASIGVQKLLDGK